MKWRAASVDFMCSYCAVWTPYIGEQLDSGNSEDSFTLVVQSLMHTIALYSFGKVEFSFSVHVRT